MGDSLRYWRIALEVESMIKGLLVPFTTPIRRCTLLSSREQVEFETVMRQR